MNGVELDELIARQDQELVTYLQNATDLTWQQVGPALDLFRERYAATQRFRGSDAQ